MCSLKCYSINNHCILVSKRLILKVTMRIVNVTGLYILERYVTNLSKNIYLGKFKLWFH